MRREGAAWPLLLAAGATTLVVTIASNVAIERLTFNCHVEDCTPDGYLLLMPLALAAFWSMAAAPSRGIASRAFWVSLVVVVPATAVNFVSALAEPPDPDKSFVAASTLVLGLLLGVPVACVLGGAGAWFGSKVLTHAISARVVAAAAGASAAVGAASLWLPWMRVYRRFGDSPSHVVAGIELANAGRVMLACCTVAALAAVVLGRMESRHAALAALVCSSVATATVVWVLLNEGLMVAAHQVVSPGDTELPLRLTDLGPGLPLAFAATTLTLTSSVLALRATATVSSRAPSTEPDESVPPASEQR
jgi:hypothetical protein